MNSTNTNTRIDCRNCGGDGYSINGGDCPACNGSGRERAAERRALTSAPYRWPEVDERRKEARRQEDRDHVLKLIGTFDVSTHGAPS
jgi:ribosomal protein L37E